MWKLCVEAVFLIILKKKKQQKTKTIQMQEKLNSLFEFENLWDLDYICTYVQWK